MAAAIASREEFLAEHAAGGRIAWREAAASSGGRKAEVGRVEGSAGEDWGLL